MKKLKTAYAFIWIVPALLAVAYWQGWLGSGGLLKSNATACYLIHTLSILWTLFIIFFSVKMLSLVRVRTEIADEPDRGRAFRNFCRWNAIRIALLLFTVVADLIIFYVTNNEGSAYCALITLIAALFCIPRESTFRKMRK